MTRRNVPAVSWLDPRLEIGPSPIHGCGLFTRGSIPMGQPLIVYGGQVLSPDKFSLLQKTSEPFNSLQIDEHLYLVENPARKPLAWMINHACSSTLWMADEVTLVSRVDLRPADELTLDYALFIGQKDWFMDLPCACKLPECRHTITGLDWQFPEVQKRYQGHFSPYINQRIEKEP